jgi:hypothetical protein
LNLSDALGMVFRKSPVLRVRRAMQSANEIGLETNAQEIELQIISGGNPERVIEAAGLCRDLGIKCEFKRLLYIDLAGKDPVEIVKNSLVPKRYTFSKFSPRLQEEISGFTKSGDFVKAKVTIIYSPPIGFEESYAPDFLHERLAVKTGLIIFQSPNAKDLSLRKEEHGVVLLSLARTHLESTQKCEVDFQLE